MSVLRHKLVVVGLAALVAAAGFLFWRSAYRPSRARNVLLVTLDTCRADHLGCYGRARIETPALDAVAARGVLCSRAVTVSPLTLPAHASILTGAFPAFHKVRNNMDFQLPKGVSTLAEILKARGYATGAVVSGVPLEASFGLNRGFDFYDDAFTRTNLNLAGEREAGIVPEKNEKRAEEATASALAMLKANAGKKFFLWVHYFDPHANYDPPAPFAHRYKDHLYDGEIAYVDECFGRLVKFMDEKGLRRNTIVVIVGDHGESLGEHGEATHGLFLYQAVLRVPLIISAPGALPSGAKWDRQVRVVDIAPTVLELLRVPGLPQAQGRSLAGMFSGREQGQDLVNTSENMFTFLTLGWSPLRALSTGRWKYIHAPTPELYDLDADPGELDNAASAHPDIVKQMRERLAAMAAETSDVPPERVALDPRVLESIRSLGYVGGAQRVQAGDSLNVAGLKDPKEMIAVMNLINQGTTESNAGRAGDALNSFKKALAADPTNLMAWRMTVDVCLRKKDFFGAREACKRIIELAPDAPSAHYKLGCVLCESGDHDGGLKEFNKSLALDPKFALGHFGIAAMRFKQGRFAEARREYEVALQLDPGLAIAAIGVAVSLERAGSASEALDFLWGRIRKHPKAPKNPYLFLTLGQMYRGAARLEEAVKCFKAGILLEPDDPEAYLALAGAHMDAGRFDEALPSLREALRIAPLSAQVHHKLGKYYLLTGQYAEAETELRKAVAFDPGLAPAWNDLGAVYHTRGLHAEAMSAYQKAVTADPAFADAWHNMGLLCIALNRFEEAATYLKKAVSLKPDDPNAAYHLAVACLKAGKPKEAETAARKALAVNPSHPQALELLRQLRTSQ